MPADCLTTDEANALQSVYRRDVKYWENWHMAARLAKREGKHPMGLTWVILPYKPGSELALLRQQMNGLYFACLQEYAEQYGLSITIEGRSNKVMLYDPDAVSPEWLLSCTHLKTELRFAA